MPVLQCGGTLILKNIIKPSMLITDFDTPLSLAEDKFLYYIVFHSPKY